MTVFIYGIHPVLEALQKRPQAFQRILLAKQNLVGPLKQIASLAKRAGIRTSYEIPKNIFRLTRSEHHQGVAAEVEPFPLMDFETLISTYKNRAEKAFFVVLDSIQDPHNFGSLLRSAACSKVQAVIFPKDRSVRLTGSVAKASAGAIEHLPLCRVVNIAATLARLKQEGIWIVGTLPNCEKNIYEFDFDLDLALVIGSEEKGIRPLVQIKCDFLVSIPMQGTLDSLNASVAGAVVLFEALRQRQKIG